MKPYVRRIVCSGLLVLSAVAAFVGYRIYFASPAVIVKPRVEIEVDGTTRTFEWVIPRNHDGRPLPLVFAFHGAGDHPDAMSAYSGLNWFAAREGFVLVYPHAIRGHWQLRLNADSTLNEPRRDFRFFEALLEQLDHQIEIDPHRIYLIGFSAGGSFAHTLAEHYSDRVAAVVAHSGVAPSGRTPVDMKRRFPMMLIVGTDDSQATVQAVQRCADRADQQGQCVQLVKIDGWGHRWSKRHNRDLWRFLFQHKLTR